jgi:putative glutamine amidotransferase
MDATRERLLSMRRPIVLVTACARELGNHSYHAVQFKYVDAVVQAAGCVPLILPALGESSDVETLLLACDGILLTGSPSNVNPAFYGATVHDPSLPQDHARDATTLPLIRAAVQRGTPLFALCRGFQEMNVAFGGTLHQAVQEVAGMMDHREDSSAPLAQQYAPAHPIDIVPGGLLERLLQRPQITVNSLHGQGIRELAPVLKVEARAADGLVEAFSVADSPAFALAVQWHPEWQAAQNPDSLRLFRAFGDACRDHDQQRSRVP